MVGLVFAVPLRVFELKEGSGEINLMEGVDAGLAVGGAVWVMLVVVLAPVAGDASMEDLQGAGLFFFQHRMGDLSPNR